MPFARGSTQGSIPAAPASCSPLKEDGYEQKWEPVLAPLSPQVWDGALEVCVQLQPDPGAIL